MGIEAIYFVPVLLLVIAAVMAFIYWLIGGNGNESY
jgi:hypothetical protein